MNILRPELLVAVGLPGSACCWNPECLWLKPRTFVAETPNVEPYSWLSLRFIHWKGWPSPSMIPYSPSLQTEATVGLPN